MKLSKPFGVPLLFPVFFFLPYESIVRIAKVSHPICIRASKYCVTNIQCKLFFN